MTGHNRERLLAAVEALRVWQRGEQRAPHKPLLLLLMLGRARIGGERSCAFPTSRMISAICSATSAHHDPPTRVPVLASEDGWRLGDPAGGVPAAASCRHPITVCRSHLAGRSAAVGMARTAT